MRLATIISRYLLGIIFFVFGLNGFFHFIPHPELGEAATQYMSGLTATGYFWPLLRGLEILGGLALLTNRFVPLALAVLAPINLQIFVFHVVLEPVNLIMTTLMILAQVMLTISYWSYFKSIFQIKALPAYKEISIDLLKQEA